MAGTTRIVPLAGIVCDRQALPREGVDAARVEEFVGLYRDELPSGNDPFPPIVCVEDRDGRLVLCDGWHRIEARRRIAAELPGRGYEELAAEVVRADGRDAVDYAYELAIDYSAVGTKQLTQRERIAAAKRLSEIRPDLSAHEIGRRLGLSHTTVLRARGSIAVTGGGTRAPTSDSTNTSPSDETSRSRQPAPPITLEQHAWRAANALRELLDIAREETRGVFGLGKPNVARAGAAVYKALERSYQDEAPAVADELFTLASATRDQARNAG